jgi:hypothetical protein
MAVADEGTLSAPYTGPWGEYFREPMVVNATMAAKARNMVFMNVAIFM